MNGIGILLGFSDGDELMRIKHEDTGMENREMSSKKNPLSGALAGCGTAALIAAALLLASCDSGSKGSDPQVEDSSSSVTDPISSGSVITSSGSVIYSSGAIYSSSSGVITSSGSVIASSSSTIGSSGSVVSSSSNTQINSSSSSAIITQSSSSAIVNSSSSATIASSSSWWLPLNAQVSYGTMTDPRDNKTYATIELNGYTVMAQNLNYGTQVNGILATDNQSNDGVVEKYCYNDSALYCERYGGLYQWAEALALPSSCNTESCADQVDTVGFHRGICPEGWHLPWREEWKDVHGIYSAYDLKSEVYWYQGGGGSNSTGFTFLPAGKRVNSTTGGYERFGQSAAIWYIGIHPTNFTYGYTVHMYYSDDGVPQQTPWYKTAGVSIRCIQDYTTSD